VRTISVPLYITQLWTFFLLFFHSSHSSGPKASTSIPSSSKLSHSSRSRGKNGLSQRNHQTSQLWHQFSWWKHPWLKRLIQHQKLRLPRLSHFEHPHIGRSCSPNSGNLAPIESKSMHQMSSASSFWKGLPLSQGTIGLSPEVRRHFKEATTWKATSFSNRGTLQAAHHVTTFSMTNTTNIFQPNQHFHFGRLRLLWITVTAQASLTVASRSSLSAKTYGKDWDAMKHEQVMFMELANGQSNVTMEWSLTSASQLERSAFTVRSGHQGSPLNASSAYPSCCAPIQNSWHLWSQNMKGKRGGIQRGLPDDLNLTVKADLSNWRSRC